MKGSRLGLAALALFVMSPLLTGMGPGAPAPVTWGACPAEYAEAQPEAECATVAVPLAHGHRNRAQVELFVARVRAKTPGAKQLWVLAGGPGSSGYTLFAGQLARLRTQMPDVDFYFPDHRGTGRSARLTCAGEDFESPRGNELSAEEWAPCIAELRAQWGDERLAHFNVTQSARDLGTLVERSRDSRDTQVFIYGLSYGTYLAWRYLELFPHQADGVIQDSVVSPGHLFISEADMYFDPVLRRYAQACAQDATCAARMGADPVARIEALYAKLDAGHCAAAGFDRARLRYSLAGLLMSWRQRVLALPLAYRLERCEPADVAALQRFLGLYFEPYDLGDTFSYLLEANISFSELWERPAPTAAELHARADGALASLDWAAERAEAFALWPRYPGTRWELDWPKVKVPLLMLNGTLDGMTPIETALAAGERYRGQGQHFVTLPHVPHGVLYNTPTTRPGAPMCGVLLIAGFLANPTAVPDTTCVGELQPLPFENAGFARSFFGAPSVWDNAAP